MKFNPQLLKDIFNKYRRIIIALLCTFLVAIIGIVSIQVYKMYKVSISAENRIEKIKTAITVASFGDLTSFIDFRQIGLDMAELIIVDPRSKFPEGSTTTSIAESVQKSLIELLNTEKVDEVEKEEDAAAISIFAPINIFPDKTLKQFISTLRILSGDDNEVIAEAVIKYERTNTEVKIHLQMQNTENYGWRITKILNAKQLLDNFYLAKQIIRNRVVNFVEEKNILTLKEMEKNFSLSSCSATITTLSDNITKLLIIEVQGYNNGPHIVFNFNIITKYYNATTKKQIDTFSLNLAKRIFPNEKFSNVWTLEIDQDNPKHKLLLDNLPLTCTVQFNNMSLSSGKIIYINQIPEEQ